MQIIYLPHWLMIVLFFAGWFIVQMGAAVFCFYLPNRMFAQDTALYKTRRWEQGGQVYQKYLRVRRWKHLLPDGGALFKGGYAKKHLANFTPQNLRLYLIESRRAELTHWLAILPFWVFGLFAPPQVVPLMLVYALAANLPCIVAQRYNRPRVQKLLAARSARAHRVLHTV